MVAGNRIILVITNKIFALRPLLLSFWIIVGSGIIYVNPATLLILVSY